MKSFFSNATSRRLSAAFSLTEVVIAMGVAAVAFTSIIALFPLGLNMSKESYEATQAALIAQTIMSITPSAGLPRTSTLKTETKKNVSETCFLSLFFCQQT